MWLEIVKYKWKPTAKLSALTTVSYIKPSIMNLCTAYQLKNLKKRRPAKLNNKRETERSFQLEKLRSNWETARQSCSPRGNRPHLRAE